jgi:hypothetical protein
MALCNREQFDAVYCDHLSMLEYGRRLGLPIVLDAHNVEFEIVRRHATTLGLSPLRAFAELEWRLLKRYERSLYPMCRLILSVSDVDLRALGNGFEARAGRGAARARSRSARRVARRARRGRPGGRAID